MIIFKKVRFRNFFSCGNSFIELELNKNPNTLIVGKNGHGKSTSVTDSVVFALFGKPFKNVVKGNVVNSINKKDCVVELEFSIGDNNYKVIRGLKPTIFDIYKNDVLIEKNASVVEYQDYLERYILKMNYKSFTQIVILGSKNFTPFMKLKPQERREIIEDLLDIQVFSVMQTIAKQNLNRIKTELQTSSSLKQTYEGTIQTLKTTINGLKQNRSVDIDQLNQRKLEIENELKNEPDTKKYDDLIDELMTTLQAHRKKEQSYQKLFYQLEDKVSQNDKSKRFYLKNTSCDVCKQSIDETFREQKIRTNDADNKKISEALVELEKKIKEKEKESNEIKKQIDEIKKQRSRLDNIIDYHNSLKRELSQIKVRIDEYHKLEKLIETNETSLKDVEQKLTATQTDYEKNLEDRKYFDVIVEMLKDNGIKTSIISNYVPIINNTINKYLNMMNFFIQFELDENFNETIKSNHRDSFTYDSFSEGEKMRIDIAILFAWRHIASIRNSVNCNLLVMDEIFDSSLDSEGTDDFVKIMLDDLTKQTNLFVITHKADQLINKFSNVIEFKKSKGFTEMIEVH